MLLAEEFVSQKFSVKIGTIEFPVEFSFDRSNLAVGGAIKIIKQCASDQPGKSGYLNPTLRGKDDAEFMSLVNACSIADLAKRLRDA